MYHRQIQALHYSASFLSVKISSLMFKTVSVPVQIRVYDLLGLMEPDVRR